MTTTREATLARWRRRIEAGAGLSVEETREVLLRNGLAPEDVEWILAELDLI